MKNVQCLVKHNDINEPKWEKHIDYRNIENIVLYAKEYANNLYDNIMRLKSNVLICVSGVDCFITFILNQTNSGDKFNEVKCAIQIIYYKSLSYTWYF